MLSLRNDIIARLQLKTAGWCFFDDGYHKPSIFLAVLIHAVVLLFALSSPRLFTPHRRVPEVYQVKLYPAPPSPTVEKKSPKKISRPAPPKKVIIQKQPAPLKTVSLAPIKERLIREKRKLDEERRRKRRLLNRKLEQLRLDQQKKEAEAEARQRAKEAVAQIAELYRSEKNLEELTTKPLIPEVVHKAGSRSEQGDATIQEALERYKARLIIHIQQNWRLPDLHEWDDTLEAVMVLKVRSDGRVLSSYFEKKSRDLRFNQHVSKAMERSRPLPPFPLDLKLDQEEIVVTFFPGGLL